jgi:hypothetical protein
MHSFHHLNLYLHDEARRKQKDLTIHLILANDSTYCTTYEVCAMSLKGSPLCMEL